MPAAEHGFSARWLEWRTPEVEYGSCAAEREGWVSPQTRSGGTVAEWFRPLFEARQQRSRSLVGPRGHDPCSRQ